MATTKLTVPIIVEMKDIEAYIAQHDVVEVVRCRDCKHRDDGGFCLGRGYPEQLVPDDGYCDKGDRKEVEDG